MAVPGYQGPPTPRPGANIDDLGTQIRQRVQQSMSQMQQGMAARRAEFDQRMHGAGEAMHNTVAHTEQAWAGVGNAVLHAFQPGGEADQIRSQIEKAVSGIPGGAQIVQNIHSSVQNTGGQRVVGKS